MLSSVFLLEYGFYHVSAIAILCIADKIITLGRLSHLQVSCSAFKIQAVFSFRAWILIVDYRNI